MCKGKLSPPASPFPPPPRPPLWRHPLRDNPSGTGPDLSRRQRLSRSPNSPLYPLASSIRGSTSRTGPLFPFHRRGGHLGSERHRRRLRCNRHNHSGGCLHLTTPNLDVSSTSPAVGTGVVLGAAVNGTVDFAGNPRTVNGQINIGAYEE